MRSPDTDPKHFLDEHLSTFHHIPQDYEELVNGQWEPISSLMRRNIRAGLPGSGWRIDPGDPRYFAKQFEDDAVVVHNPGHPDVQIAIDITNNKIPGSTDNSGTSILMAEHSLKGTAVLPDPQGRNDPIWNLSTNIALTRTNTR